MSFVIVTSAEQVAALPDGTLISWLPVMDDASSEAVAFVRKTVTTLTRSAGDGSNVDVWIAPGNGWSPEPLASIVFPARIILLGVPQPGDWVPEDYLTSTDTDDPAAPTEAQFLGYAPSDDTLTITGGTYPRDVALQAAATIWADAKAVTAAQVIAMAADFAKWLGDGPLNRLSADLIDRGTVPAGYFSGGVDHA